MEKTNHTDQDFRVKTFMFAFDSHRVLRGKKRFLRFNA